MLPLETYLEELSVLRASGATVQETSGYGALANLLNTLGATLKPKVRCLLQLKNSGAGLPDGGLFTPDQLKHPDAETPLLGQQPSRGVIEVKSTAAELAAHTQTSQVQGYLAHYGLVLLTNYRDFLLLARGPGDATLQLESFRLADSEAAFWAAAAHPRHTAAALGERLTEYLKRILLHAAPLNNPREVAFFLASYARDARARVEAAGDLPALTAIRTALEEALGMKFEPGKGEHFFRSTLVQTLFYGVFSAWVLWHKQHVGQASRLSPFPKGTAKSETGATPVLPFDWRAAAWTLHVPMIKALFEQVATPTKLGPLGLVEVLDWTAAALNRVDRPAFFEKFLETHAVQYFYEPFLEAFDPELRKELGVWYTPPEIVQYQVARVDAILKHEMDIHDGLADPRVYVLDPCCGTGAYLVEVLRHIYHFHREDQGLGDLSQLLVKEAATKRVFGFELLPAPFVVAHLQLGLLLQNLRVPLKEAEGERAVVYLTNALTGWEPPTEAAKKQLTFLIPEFQAEKGAADEIKQEKRIIVILGNPPYNGFAGIAVEEERGLSDAYRTTKLAPEPQGQGLNDLYVRFFRMAERRIVEESGEGIVCFISNYSWLDGLSFTGMRERYLEVFDSITVDCLNGDKYKTGKLTPEGASDPSVFSTEFNREGIQVGTAITTLVCRSRRKEAHTSKKKSPSLLASAPTNEIHFRHLWGKDKRAELLKTIGEPREKVYQMLKPPVELGLPFLPAKTEAGFFKWPLLPGLFPISFPGVKTSRDDFLVDMDRDVLTNRMENYFDPKVSHEEMRRIAPGVMENTARFRAELVRDELRERGFLRKNIVRYCYRPFDVRWLYWEPETKLLDEKRTDYFLQVFDGNLWLSAGQRNRKEDFYQPQFTAVLADHHIVESNVGVFPLWLRPNPDTSSLFDRVGGDQPKANVTDEAKDYLASLRLGNKPEELFYHTLAVLHSPSYRTQNAGALRQDWPRVPLPKSREALLASADLGRQVAALLDTEVPVSGVTSDRPRAELKLIGELSYSGALDLRVTAGWGHTGKAGVTMPGKGKLATRGYDPGEAAAFGVGQASRLSPSSANLEKSETGATPVLPLLGHATHDVYLNATAYWRNVPERVWDFTLGGYQVLKKWLSYREHELLGRPLTTDEAREVTHTARRLAALILLQPELDANYQRIKSATHAWPV
jgi:hypothetical protein